MREQDIEIDEGGRRVACRMNAKTLELAHLVHKFADENHPKGYVLSSAKITRRPKGGRLRYVTLIYRHTGTEYHTPIADWDEWDELLAPEQAIARGGAVAGGV